MLLFFKKIKKIIFLKGNKKIICSLKSAKGQNNRYIPIFFYKLKKIFTTLLILIFQLSKVCETVVPFYLAWDKL